MDTTADPVTPARLDLASFLARYEAALQDVFRSADAGRMQLSRGLPPSLMRHLLAQQPLSVFIPSEHGGRGGRIEEGLAVLELTGYESLGMSLTVGINGALFLQPVARYGRDEIKPAIFERFLEHQNMGGLMMTEPNFGSDALSMETAHERDGDRVRIRGVKHWAGLTGLADYWLMTARARGENGNLTRDIDFFVLDTHSPEHSIVVEERFENLGLYQIPYGRNRVDATVGEEQRLVPHRSGLKMMLDILHRSRVQFPGMGLGFLRRMTDEALDHVRSRHVGGRSLWGYDQVQRRLARLQAGVTAGSAMCLFSANRAGIDSDLSKDAIPANAIKALMTDLMQEGSQSLLQLVGAKGYRLDHFAGRATVDSRPFQIFEGSNDILYEQLADAVIKRMRREGEPHLGAFLKRFELGAQAVEHLKDLVDVRIETDMVQRHVVDFGRVISRIVAMELIIDLGARGFRQDLIASALEQFRGEVASLFAVFHAGARTEAVEERVAGGGWLRQLAAK